MGVCVYSAAVQEPGRKATEQRKKRGRKSEKKSRKKTTWGRSQAVSFAWRPHVQLRQRARLPNLKESDVVRRVAQCHCAGPSGRPPGLPKAETQLPPRRVVLLVQRTDTTSRKGGQAAEAVFTPSGRRW